MRKFTIEKNHFLSQNITGYYHTDYVSYERRHEVENYPDYLLILKNDPERNWWKSKLDEAQRKLKLVILNDLPKIATELNLDFLLVCVVPRAKINSRYRVDQLLFKETIKNAISELGPIFRDGTDFITRVEDTKTTHLRKNIDGYDNNGSNPYIGISNNTCNFSPDISDNHILLIDDIYTKTVNIDEDMIQALLNMGAKSVTFYAIGNTKSITPTITL